MADASTLEAIEAVEHLYLREISKPTDYSLRLIVGEATERSSSPEATAGAPAVVNKRLRTESAHGRVFELYWPSYAAYLVTEESVGSSAHHGYSDESYTGRVLRLYSKSHFLEHIAQDTGGHPGTVLHYKLICRNHLIDVAAYAPPEARVLTQSTGKKAPAFRHIGGIIGPY